MTNLNSAARIFAARKNLWRCCVCTKNREESMMRLVLAPRVGLRDEADWCCKSCLSTVTGEIVDYCAKCWHSDLDQHVASDLCPEKSISERRRERRGSASQDIESAVARLDDVEDADIIEKLRGAIAALEDDEES